MKLKQTLRCVFFILGIGVLLWGGRPIQADRPAQTPVPHLTHSPTPQVNSGPLELISKAAPGQETNSVFLEYFFGGMDEFSQTKYAASDDGRFVAFVSRFNAVVAGQDDTNYINDVFLADRLTGVVKLVSHAATSPVQACNAMYPGGLTGRVAISGDGRYVAFLSTTTDLVPGITYPYPYPDTFRNVYLYDRLDGTNLLVSRSAASATTAGNGGCPQYDYVPKVSADGRYVAFASSATDLVAGQTVGGAPYPYTNLFLFDRVTGLTALVSHTATSLTTTGNGFVRNPFEMTPDGQWIVFASTSTDHVPGQNNPPDYSTNVFLYNRATQAVTLVSRATGSSSVANGYSSNPKISGNGQTVVFDSTATNLVPGFTDTNGVGNDIFSSDLTTGTITLVSHIPGSPLTTGNGTSELPTMSADGTIIVYRSTASDLVPGQIDDNSRADAFLFDRQKGTTTLVSHAPGNPVMSGTTDVGIFSDELSPLALSRDGRWVAYEASGSSNLVAGQIDQDLVKPSIQLFVFDRLDGTNRLATHKYGAPTTAGTGYGIYISPIFAGTSGLVLFEGIFADLTAIPLESLNYIWLFGFDLNSGLVSMESRRSADAPRSIAGNGRSFGGGASADGRFVVLSSSSQNLVSGQINRTNNFHPNNVFLADRATGTTTLVSHADGLPTTTANQPSAGGPISKDGRFIAFVSIATNLVPGQVKIGFGSDIFLYDRLTETTRLVSHQANSTTTGGNGESYGSALSADGRWLVFVSSATNLVAGATYGNTGPHIFLYNLESGTIRLVSHAADSLVTAANGGTNTDINPVISADGSTIAYVSRATNLVAGQGVTNHLDDLFVYSVSNQTNVLASRPAFPQSTVSGRIQQYQALAISSDGNWLGFGSNAGNLVAGQTTNNLYQVFLFNRTTGTTQLVSHIPGSPATGGNGASEGPTISGDGKTVVFYSQAPDLIPGQIDPVLSTDVFAFDQITGSMTLISHIANSPAMAGGGYGGYINSSGTAIVFYSGATNLVPGQVDAPNTGDLFLFDRATGLTSLVSYKPGLPLTAIGFNDFSFQSNVIALENALVFTSKGSNLVPNDWNGFEDVYVAWLGPVNLNYPTVQAASGLTRQQGSTGSSSVLGTVSDAQSPPGSLQVAVTAPTGISVTGLVNQNGTISGNITVACGVALGPKTLILRVTNGAGNATDAAIQVNITANTPPAVGSYQAVNVVLGSPTTVTPSAPPTDNGTVATVTVAASAGFSGPLTVNPATGMVSFTAGAEGTFTLTVTATDNCGSTTQQSFSVTVLPFGKGPVINSLSPTSGPAGTSVTISGLNLMGVTQVTFNGRPAAFTVNAATQITATVPIGAATGPVAVAGPNGAATGPVFTVIRTK
ncbi:MAG: hypothetical protein K1Y36_07665 [Blastocatellia bacterium]|nr:hypothetical protein [Blastocatellia bacterium]